jgi:large subunit ribosomal protein L17
MRHKKKFNHLGRKAPHRKSMLANMASSLILHKRITTTTAKAKALRSFVEPVITRSREDSTHSRRIAFQQLRDKEAVNELFRDVSGKIGDRPGGYTRIIKTGNRTGDGADMCIIELVDYNENLLSEKAAVKARTGRRRRGGKKKADQPVVPMAESPEAAGEATGTIETSAEEIPMEEIQDTAPVDPPAPEPAAEAQAPADEVPTDEATSEVDSTAEKAPSDEAAADESTPGEPDATDEEISSDKETK